MVFVANGITRNIQNHCNLRCYVSVASLLRLCYVSVGSLLRLCYVSVTVLRLSYCSSRYHSLRESSVSILDKAHLALDSNTEFNTCLREFDAWIGEIEATQGEIGAMEALRDKQTAIQVNV